MLHSPVVRHHQPTANLAATITLPVLTWKTENDLGGTGKKKRNDFPQIHTLVILSLSNGRDRQVPIKQV